MRPDDFHVCDRCGTKEKCRLIRKDWYVATETERTKRYHTCSKCGFQWEEKG